MADETSAEAFFVAATRTEDKPPAVPWTSWRGTDRTATVPWLPDALPDAPQMVWRLPLVHAGLGGIAATDEVVLFADRDPTDTADLYRCVDAKTGIPLWQFTVPSAGNLDYGNSPRTTPVIDGPRVYVLGAFGDLVCLKLATGVPLWQKNLPRDFGATDDRPWGFCSTPLVEDGVLIVNPGGPQAALVGLDPLSGVVLWKTPGDPAGYGSLIVASVAGKKQVIGHTKRTLVGWDAATGKQLWSLPVSRSMEFFVPTPTMVGDKLLVTSENQGTRLYAFDAAGQIVSQPVATEKALAPDISSPVCSNGRCYCVWDELFCLDASGGLSEVWRGKDRALGSFGALIAAPNRLLVVGLGAELLLVDTSASEFKLLDRLKIFNHKAEMYSHPAVVGSRIYLRGENELLCLELAAE